MLGRHADAFFRKQGSERIIASPANGDSRSLNVPDRESPGTHQVFRTPGSYEMPGPQNSVDANSMMPGMGDHDMLPGMGEYVGATRDMLPGMGEYVGATRDMLPGMGFLMDLSTSTKWVLAGAGVLALGFLISKRRGARFA